jgi:hypothetical protein
MGRMKTRYSSSGFVLVTTLMIVSLAVVLISFIINRSTVFFPLARTTIDREKAKELALGGLQFSLSQLAYADVIQSEEKRGAKTSPDQKPEAPNTLNQARQMLKNLVPVLNKWLTIKLDSARDGIDGEIKVCIASEDGKINLNELYDFQRHEFVGKGKEQEELKKLLQEILSSIKKAGTEDLFQSLEAFLKERNDKLRDITELLSIKSFALFKNELFYNPDTQGSGNKKSLYLNDLFTLWSRKGTMDPWLLSSSVCALLNLAELKKGPVADAIKNFKGSYSWPADWNSIFSKLYKKDFNSLPKGITRILSVNFGPETFSVLSYGTVGQITHRLYAIVERDTTNREAKEPAKVTIKKLYWV